MSAARDRWLDEGIDVLMEEGFTGVRIDRLAARLGLSKGSFHHHFKGAEGYKKALLDHIEQMMTSAVEEAVASAKDESSASEVFLRLNAMVIDTDDQLYQPKLETALRTWALIDPEAARTQERIDSGRLEVLRRVWHRLSDDEETIRLGGLLPYVLVLGASVLMPPLTPEELGKLFEFIHPLVPDDLPAGDSPETS